MTFTHFRIQDPAQKVYVEKIWISAPDARGRTQWVRLRFSNGRFWDCSKTHFKKYYGLLP